MKVSDIVNNKIDRLRPGYIFTYEDFNVPVDKVEALKKILSRLVASGKIVRLSKGQFYKPEKSEFGILRPPEYQIVKDLLEDNNKIVGYITGVSMYNKFGLTTQVSNTILIGTNIQRKPRKRGKYSIRFIKQKNTITNENIEKLQLLDAIRFIKRIPDADVSQSCSRIMSIIQQYSNTDQELFVKYALKYNPGTRTLLGAILDQVNDSINTDTLYDSLNPATEFKIGIKDDLLITKDKWRIV
ncbi:MAG: DUF6088 family protein [Bacteroidales bacterium]|nr:DUF6088 family protein [Bacteroidales bacterium]